MQLKHVSLDLPDLRMKESAAKMEEMEETVRQLKTEFLIDFLQNFGHPNEFAAGYRLAVDFDDPEGGGKSLSINIIGLALTRGFDLLGILRQSIPARADFICAFGSPRINPSSSS